MPAPPALTGPEALAEAARLILVAADSIAGHDVAELEVGLGMVATALEAFAKAMDADEGWS